MKLRLVLAAALLSASGTTLAGPLVYTPLNPSFGGNPMNSSHLIGLASAQRTATAFDAGLDSGPGGSDGGGLTPGTSDAELFVRQLQSRLLSALASQVTEAIFGENPQNSGTVVFGDTTVKFVRGLKEIRLSITDPSGTTEIVVPQLLVN